MYSKSRDHNSSNNNREKKADRDQSPVSKTKQSSQDNEVLHVKKIKRTRRSDPRWKKKTKNQRVKKMTMYMTKIKNVIMNQALEQMKTKVDE